MPIATETYGALGPQGLKLIKEIGKRIPEVTHENRYPWFTNCKLKPEQFNHPWYLAPCLQTWQKQWGFHTCTHVQSITVILFLMHTKCLSI